MRPALDDGDQDFLRLMQSLGSVTVQDLCDAAQVTPTAIRQRLTRLKDLRLIDRVVIRAGRGRPHHRYEITDAGRRMLGDNFGELAAILWDEVQRISNVEVREDVLSRIRQQFASRLGGKVTGNSLDQRLQQLKEALSQRGYDVQVYATPEGVSILQENHCPYHDLAVIDPGICDLEQQAFEQILGSPLKLLRSCRDGATCCQFELAAPATADLRGNVELD